MSIGALCSVLLNALLHPSEDMFAWSVENAENLIREDLGLIDYESEIGDEIKDGNDAVCVRVHLGLHSRVSRYGSYCDLDVHFRDYCWYSAIVLKLMRLPRSVVYRYGDDLVVAGNKCNLLTYVGYNASDCSLSEMAALNKLSSGSVSGRRDTKTTTFVDFGSAGCTRECPTAAQLELNSVHYVAWGKKNLQQPQPDSHSESRRWLAHRLSLAQSGVSVVALAAVTMPHTPPLGQHSGMVVHGDSWEQSCLPSGAVYLRRKFLKAGKGNGRATASLPPQSNQEGKQFDT